MGSYNTSMEMTNPDDFGITIIELIWTINKRSDRSNSPLNLFYSARSIGSGCVSMEDYSLEGFELLDKIGEGTYGDVYKARNTSDGKICAIKFVYCSPSSLDIDPLS